MSHTHQVLVPSLPHRPHGRTGDLAGRQTPAAPLGAPPRAVIEKRVGEKVAEISKVPEACREGQTSIQSQLYSTNLAESIFSFTHLKFQFLTAVLITLSPALQLFIKLQGRVRKNKKCYPESKNQEKSEI